MLIASSMQAQPDGHHGPPPIPNDDQINEMILKMTDELSLNDSQKEKIRNMYFTHFAELRRKVEQHKKARENERKDMEQMRINFEKQVKLILTDEQQTKFDTFRKENRPKGGKGRKQ